MFERPAEQLLTALVSSFGDTPRWELRSNKGFGLVLAYDEGQAEMSEVRRVIEQTLGFGIGVILSPRFPSPGGQLVDSRSDYRMN
ncbi:hypothetical protein BJY16_001814 [Actinoplanes octamycinicus]|uniref:Uncharacterized protein n=1 Tax=Actinoplanes octamycinicus TaxID=135948 RepID=A0A7W7GU56_9ACTN|nr:hypothetical protein [Actinoplanes octamycinicus]MBB4738355.1 hypothetical protein [Actinoplanes octamycinicus]GIE57472.1 hypothetical protein Aoc01nite_28740 [Actinoplanes octamycinicus]